MKNYIPALLILSTIHVQNPVHWTFSAQKTGKNTYLVHCMASIDEGWHLYSQNQPKSAICQPTTIQWMTNPLVIRSGKATENGKIEHFSDPVSGIQANQYERQVDFVQPVTLRAAVKTALAGKLTFQVCTDEMCLPPKTIPFEVSLP